ncbi:MAG: hypothetical protein R3C42_08725 [Parvularculaceae bacterium]
MTEFGHPPYYYENMEGGHGGTANQDQLAYRTAPRMGLFRAYADGSGRIVRTALFTIAAALAVLTAPATLLWADEPEPATREEIVAAHEVLVQWISAFQAGDYRAQWRLTDLRIRRWHDRRR